MSAPYRIPARIETERLVIRRYREDDAETLSEVAAPIFFLFTVKCSEVARHVGKRKQLDPQRLPGQGEMLLMAQERQAG